ncbi:response regulator [Pseudomonas sp. CCOS 191]|uniref:response regulator n=1 Tax=Pseudomonas sp. CCOS 191 TaxID=1649877 RepID=UPI0018E67D4B|nr:response regulator [Pseudomonas sp. CCOS 191]MBI6952023.1 response regulator [Pseudomonas sp. CCOS 191]
MPTAHTAKPYTLLAIDDDPQSLVILSKVLTAEYEVLLAKSSARGLELARNSQPDLIILDITMPEMDGFQVLGELRKHAVTASIPVIFLTSRTSVEDERLGFLLGASDYITKPISPPVVLARVATHLGYRDKLLHPCQPDGDSTAGSDMREGFISALALQLRHNPRLRLDALLDSFAALLGHVLSEPDQGALRSAACLALIGLGQPHDSLPQALGAGRLLIEEIIGHTNAEDPVLNLAWDLSHADVMLDGGASSSLPEHAPLSTRLFALVLTYHLALLQPAANVALRHDRALGAMLSHPAALNLPSDTEGLCSTLLGIARAHLDR